MLSSLKMYYHGTKKCAESPFAGDNYTFWQYPVTYPLTSRWDTHYEAALYCKNHRCEGPDPNNRVLKRFICLGHTSVNDMRVAEEEWAARSDRSSKKDPLLERLESLERDTSNGIANIQERQSILESASKRGLATIQERLEGIEKNTVTIDKLTERLEFYSKCIIDLQERVEELESKSASSICDSSAPALASASASVSPSDLIPPFKSLVDDMIKLEERVNTIEFKPSPLEKSPLVHQCLAVTSLLLFTIMLCYIFSTLLTNRAYSKDLTISSRDLSGSC